MISIESGIKACLESWNKQCVTSNLDYGFDYKIQCRVKKFYINKKDFFEQRIAEFSLYQTGKKPLLLWRKELRMPDKVKNVQQQDIDMDYMEQLYHYFLYEMMGSFCVLTRQAIINQDHAEYDVELDRLKPHPNSNGMIIQTTKAGEFFEPNDQFDVFHYTDGNYWVYTAHERGRPNNGLAKISDKDCMIIKQAVPTLELL